LDIDEKNKDFLDKLFPRKKETSKKENGASFPEFFEDKEKCRQNFKQWGVSIGMFDCNLEVDDHEIGWEGSTETLSEISTTVPQEIAFRTLFLLYPILDSFFQSHSRSLRGPVSLSSLTEQMGLPSSFSSTSFIRPFLMPNYCTDLDPSVSHNMKSFVRRKKKGSDQRIEALNPPEAVVGYDEEWLQVSHSVVRLWEKAGLDPYSPKKEIFYVCLLPSSPDLLLEAKAFLLELSNVYEACHLGKHSPLSHKSLNDGILEVTFPRSECHSKQDFETAKRTYFEAAKSLGTTLQQIHSTLTSSNF